jgi:hypothetical protein
MTYTAFEFQFKNARNKRLSLRIEPWGKVSKIEPGHSLRLRVEGPISDDPSRCLMVQVESDQEASVWGWTGSNITVLTP